MNNKQIEDKIIQLLTEGGYYTIYLLRQEFKPRQADKVRSAVQRLREAGKIRLDSHSVLHLGPEPVAMDC
jgi:hypothetical protein